MTIPTRKQMRLQDYDYRTVNAYFITICTQNRECLFWTKPDAVINQPQDLHLSFWGCIVKSAITEIPKHYPAVSVDKYVIMPNHVHLLLQIHADGSGQYPTVSTIIGMMKRTVSKESGRSLWQKGFYDHVIRGDQDYRDVWNYIEGNPMKWTEDKLYSASIIRT